MSDKKTSEDKQGRPDAEDAAGAPRPETAGEERPVPDAADARAREESAAEEQAETVHDTDPASPAGSGYDPNRPETDAEGAAPLGEPPETAREAQEAEEAELPADEAERRREDEFAAGLEERGSEDEAAAMREPEPVHPAEEPFEEHEEHPRPSLAARALQGLVLLLIGAGVALWAAPRIAPHVPEPVSRYLSAPQAVERADLEALRAEVESQLAARTEALSGQIEAGRPDLDAALAPLRERLDGLAARVEQAGGAAPERVASLENAVSDLRAQLEALQASLSGLGEGGGGGGGEVPPELADRIAGFNAVVESLRAELKSVSSRTEQLAARLDAAEARFEEEADKARQATDAAQAEAQAARREAALSAGFRDLSAALDEGRPYADTLEAMSAHAEPPQALAAAAGTGVPTLAELREGFAAAGRRAMEAQSLAEAGDGALDRALAAIRGRLAGVPVDAMEGEGLEPALGRAAAALRRGDLAAALSELDDVSDPAREAMSDWLSQARARQDAVAAMRDWRERVLGGA